MTANADMDAWRPTKTRNHYERRKRTTCL